MRNIKLTISYDGTEYKGWQCQKNARTVQEEIERSVEKVFGRRCVLYGASRTDAGVHAACQVANFKAPGNIPVERIPSALNANLPEDISIRSAEEMPHDFHSRFCAVSKKYEYHIRTSQVRDPFSSKYAWRVPYKLNTALIRREASVLTGEHDFRSFQAKDKVERSSVRVITNITVKKNKDNILIIIEGNGFLYNMVRNIVGTLVEIGRGYFPKGTMSKVLSAKDRRSAGPTAPARGLFLVDVRY